MSYAEQRYLSDKPFIDNDYRDELLYGNPPVESVLPEIGSPDDERWEIVESSLRSFLKLNEDSHLGPARAYSALNTTEAIKWELAQKGLDQTDGSKIALNPVMVNDAIAYMAQTELLAFYGAQNISSRALVTEKKVHRELQGNFRDTVKKYVSSFGGSQIDLAYQGITEALDLASVIVIGPTAGRKKKSVVNAKMRVELPADAKNAVKVRQRAGHLALVK